MNNLNSKGIYLQAPNPDNILFVRIQHAVLVVAYVGLITYSNLILGTAGHLPFQLAFLLPNVLFMINPELAESKMSEKLVSNILSIALASLIYGPLFYLLADRERTIIIGEFLVFYALPAALLFGTIYLYIGEVRKAMKKRNYYIQTQNLISTHQMV
mmetsp:Transcript_20300/g.17975  ORF Transcript_20300/g.17975 Transcript_20300/m.17975 type:complete len:157 (+) Transcript_20300:3-473(+)